jgi:hypothetical protein
MFDVFGAIDSPAISPAKTRTSESKLDSDSKYTELLIDDDIADAKDTGDVAEVSHVIYGVCDTISDLRRLYTVPITVLMPVPIIIMCAGQAQWAERG